MMKTLAFLKVLPHKAAFCDRAGAFTQNQKTALQEERFQREILR
jgi:hypothetical protein